MNIKTRVLRRDLWLGPAEDEKLRKLGFAVRISKNGIINLIIKAYLAKELGQQKRFKYWRNKIDSLHKAARKYYKNWPEYRDRCGE